MDRTSEIVLLNLVERLGPATQHRLLRRFPVPGSLLSATRDALREAGLPGEIAAALLEARQRGLHEREMERANRLGMQIVTYGEPGFPARLLQLDPIPPLLYVLGTIEPEDHLAVAIVGARRCSHHGRVQAFQYGFDLGKIGITVVSGMARGVDSTAHDGALEAGGRTLAVLGSGLNVVYPRENRPLFDRIIGAGAVISQFPLDASPLAWHFPLRNRLISGLTLGVLVIEATRKSGSLITVDWALDQGKEVFALPGNVDRELSLGTNHLIQDGAKLVTGVPDILDEFPECEGMKMKTTTQPEPEGTVPLGPREKRLLGQISNDPVHLDELVERTGYPVSVVSAVMTLLEMKKVALQLPGKRFVKNHPRSVLPVERTSGSNPDHKGDDNAEQRGSGREADREA